MNCKQFFLIIFIVVGVVFAQKNANELPTIAPTSDDKDLSGEALDVFPGLREKRELDLINVLLNRLEESLRGVDLDPVKRVGVHRVKMNFDFIDRGLAGYIQGRIEEAFVQYANFNLVSSPELSQITVISTDTSLQIYNAIPDIETLWKLGKDLYLDAFLQGEIGKTANGGYYLNVRVIKQRTGDVLWSKNFLIGEYVQSEDIRRFSLGVGIRFLTVAKDNITIAWESPTFSESYLQLGYRNRLLETYRFWYTIRLGLGLFTSAVTNPQATVAKTEQFPVLRVAWEMAYVLIPSRKGIIDGRGLLSLGIFAGATSSVLLYDGRLLSLSVFAITHFSRYFSIKAQVEQFIGGTTLIGRNETFIQTTGNNFNFRGLAYNVEILWDI